MGACVQNLVQGTLTMRVGCAQSAYVARGVAGKGECVRESTISDKIRIYRFSSFLRLLKILK